LRIVVNPFRGQVAAAACLEVEPENGHIFILERVAPVTASSGRTDQGKPDD
jgi:hypothetical protein